MFKRLSLILFVATLALSVFFAGMWVWQSRAFPYHLARSAHKTLMVALEMRGFIAPEAERAPVATAEVFPMSGPGLLECDQSEAARELSNKLRESEFFTQLKCPVKRVASREASAKRIEFITADRLAGPVLLGGGLSLFLEHCPPPPPPIWGCRWLPSGGVLARWRSEPRRAIPSPSHRSGQYRF